ncbi:hypothetical protein EDD11_010024 [Mortierella claussenii]|nr:hypothetical protein EDD11_010024 [Mortierella claussenii]
METYPPEFIIHLQPSLVVTGLTTEDNAPHQLGAEKLPHASSSDTPPPPRPSTGNAASGLEVQKATLLQAMLARNNVSYWDNTKGLAGSLFYVVPEHRNYILPPTRKSLQQTYQQHLYPSSSLSPSSPSSPLYPDGLISPLWIRRHREQIPSVYIAFVDLWDRESIIGNGEGNGPQLGFSDKGPLGVVDPMERERDIILAQELLERRKAAQERAVKFAAVIMLQRSHMEDPSIEDRLSFVRKSAGLDIKNSFYTLPPSSSQEITDFVVNLQRSQYEGSMSYYKEQVKRHKKKKASLPATTASVRPAQQQPIGGASQQTQLQQQQQQQQQQKQQQQQQQQGLSVQGWMMRYEFKMGVFSECKQDIDNAVKHYESAYGLLIDMFAVNSTITPGASGLQKRTKRWAEAKVLADCLCLKICKFHLYLDAPSTALFNFRRHLIVFKAFSDSWRMGDDSFEYWAWLGKQYKVFGDLLYISTKLGFKLPPPAPGSVVYGSLAGMSDGSKDLNKFSGIGLGSSTTGFGIGPGGAAFLYGGNVGGGRGGGTHGPGAGINPMLVLQHAGYFYHQAANCSVQRRLRFEIVEEAYPDSNVTPVASPNKPYPPTLQSMNAERAIDHLDLTIELLTKSYEQFKRYKTGRMTLFLESEIAGTYYTAGKFAMALKFFERIGKTYRKEGWTLILTSILKWSIQCAKELGYWENVVEYLIEMMSPDMPSTEAKRQSIFDELVSILYTEIHPANTVGHKPLVLNMPQINSFVTCNVQFQKRQAFVSSESKFQVHLQTQGGQGSLPKPFRITFVHVEFSDATLNHRFEDTRPYAQGDTVDDISQEVCTKDRTGRSLAWIDCTQCRWEQVDDSSGTEGSLSQHAWKKTVHLDIRPFETKVLEGIIVPTTEQVVKAVKVTLGIVTEHWNVALEFPLQDPVEEQDQTVPQHSLMPVQGEAPRRQWLEVHASVSDSTPKLCLKSLDKGKRLTTALRIVPRESKVEIKTLFRSPAYLDEYFPVKIKVRNGETCPVAMEMDVELQSIDPTIESLDSIVLDPHAAAAQLHSPDGMRAIQTLKGLRLSRSSKQEEKEGHAQDSDEAVEEILVGAWAEKTVYIRALEIPAPRTILCKVRYEISLDKDQKKTWTEKHHSFKVLFILPFDADVDYVQQPAQVVEIGYSSNSVSNEEVKVKVKDLPPVLKPNQVDDKQGTVLIPALTHKELYMMSARINNEGPWLVEVKGVQLITSSSPDTVLDGPVKDVSMPQGLSRSYSINRAKERKRSLQDVGVHVDLLESGTFNQLNHSQGDCVVQYWKPGNLQTFNHMIQVVAADLELAPEHIDIGILRIQWRRHEEDGANELPYAVTNVPLLPLMLPKPEVYMTVARYQVHNPTQRVHELAMTVEPSDGMVYAGTMQTVIKLLPYATYPIQMNCYPLSPGLVKLPRVKLVVNERKLTGRRGRPAPSPTPQQQQQQHQQKQEVQVKVRGAIATKSGAGGGPGSVGWSAEAVVIFVKPETGLMD